MSYIKKSAQRFKSQYKTLLNKIKEYKKIAIFRHIAPDYDALGSQFGLATFIKDNFVDKEVIVLGDNHAVFTGKIVPETDRVSEEWFNEPFLAIVVDVGDKKRVADPRFLKANYIFKIDHHPATEDWPNEAILDTESCAAAELVANFVLSCPKSLVLTRLAAEYLYIGIVGDSGRFQYSSTSANTFEVAQRLLETGINITNIYSRMYEKTIDDLEITKFILNNYKVSPKGVAYYVLTQADLDKFAIDTNRGKENVNLFSNIQGIKIWCSITEDVTEPCFRISIRSRNYVINGVANQFQGGGHAQASGAQIKDLTELPKFIAALEKLIEETDK